MALTISPALREKMIEATKRAGAMETAMAERARRLTPISFNKYRTPTADNEGCAWSVGLMNLTEGDVADLMKVADELQRRRSAAAARDLGIGMRGPAPTNAERLEAMMAGVKAGTISKTTFMEEIRRTSDLGYDQERRAEVLRSLVSDKDDDRRKLLTGVFDVPMEDEKVEPVKGNRFSGLDIE